jgi:hypothetical protein
MSGAPIGLPPLAQDYTPEQREAYVAYLATLPLNELRERQLSKGYEISATYVTRVSDELIVSLFEQAAQIADAIKYQSGR